jgi:hypothetical protein
MMNRLIGAAALSLVLATPAMAMHHRYHHHYGYRNVYQNDFDRRNTFN